MYSTSAFAVDPAITQANNDYFEILKNVEIVKDRSQSELERKRAFTNFANEFGDPGSNWMTLKISVLEIIIADAAFWAQEIIHFPAIQEKLVEEFSLDWYNDGVSDYNEKRKLALANLAQHLENISKESKLIYEMHKKLNSVVPTTLQ